jgi:hypothetical protein
MTKPYKEKVYETHFPRGSSWVTVSPTGGMSFELTLGYDSVAGQIDVETARELAGKLNQAANEAEHRRGNPRIDNSPEAQRVRKLVAQTIAWVQSPEGQASIERALAESQAATDKLRVPLNWEDGYE